MIIFCLDSFLWYNCGNLSAKTTRLLFNHFSRERERVTRKEHSHLQYAEEERKKTFELVFHSKNKNKEDDVDIVKRFGLRLFHYLWKTTTTYTDTHVCAHSPKWRNNWGPGGPGVHQKKKTRWSVIFLFFFLFGVIIMALMRETFHMLLCRRRSCS